MLGMLGAAERPVCWHVVSDGENGGALVRGELGCGSDRVGCCVL